MRKREAGVDIVLRKCQIDIQRCYRGLVASQEEGEGLRGGLVIGHAAAVLVLAADHEAQEGARLHSTRLLARVSRMRLNVHRWRS